MFGLFVILTFNLLIPKKTNQFNFVSVDAYQNCKFHEIPRTVYEIVFTNFVGTYANASCT